MQIRKKLSFLLTAYWVCTPTYVLAQLYNGSGVGDGAGAVNVQGLPDGDIRTVILNILTTVLSFLALIAVIMVIIAGIIMITSMGQDDKKEQAKKIILYTLIGLMIVLFARVIVGIVTVMIARGT